MATIRTIAEFVARSFWLLDQELGSSAADLIHFVKCLGWILPEIPPTLQNLQDAIGRVSESLSVLIEKRWLRNEDTYSDTEVAEAAATLLSEVLSLTAKLHELPNTLRSELTADYLAATSIADEFVKRLFDWLLVRLLNEQDLVAYDICVFLGFVERTEEPADPPKHQPEFVRYTIRWDRLPRLFLDPSAFFQDVYGWGTPTLDAEKLFDAVLDLSFALVMPGELRYPAREFVQAIAPEGVVSEETGPDPQLWFPLTWTDATSAFLVTYLLPKATPDELQGLATMLVLSEDAPSTIPLTYGVTLSFEGTATLGSGAALVIRPDRTPQVVLDAFDTTHAFTSGRIAARLDFENDESQPLLSENGGSRLEAQELFIGGAAEVITGGAVEALVEAGIVKGKLVISPAGADGFLQKILPQDPIEIDFDLTFGISSEKGFYIRGGAGFKYILVVNESFGPIFVYSVDLELAASEKSLILITAASGGTEIGPVTAVIREFGLKTMLEFGKPGLLGNADLSLGFKPPGGVGLSIDAEGITGGGFLEIDPPNYAGVMQLSFQNEIDVTAFGLITTKLPDGTEGFSLVIQIMAEFQPIQIGLGFALTGVGGLIGINRQLCEEGIKQAFKTHALDTILFSKSPINAVKIIESIQSIMPPREGYHIFGPMVQLFWGGSIRLVEFEVGIFIQLGGPLKIVIIGQARSHLPRGDNPRLVINVDVLGIIDFGEDRVAIDAVLFDSRILDYTLDGKMALRADWSSGEESFALSVGGFHPRFQEIPPGFPQLTRLMVAIGSGNPKLALSMYLAITPNTLQIGAQLDLWAKKKGFTITGGAGFDALFTFVPFSFLVTINMWVNVKKSIIDLGVWLELELSGPNPIVAAGFAKFKVGWFTAKVSFRAEFGKKIPELLAVVSPLAALITELEHPRTIRFQLPAWASANLVFTQDAESKIDPLADLIITQNAVPLNFTMDRFGGGTPPEGERKLQLTAGLGDDKEAAVKSLFAPEQFKNWTVDQRLSARPFEKYEAGIRFSGEYVIPEDHIEKRPVEFETVLRESKAYREQLPVSDYRSALVRTTCVWQPGENEAKFFANWSLFGASSYFKPLRKVRDKSQPDYIRVAEPAFSLSSNQAQNGKFTAAVIEGQANGDMTYAEALEVSKQVKDAKLVIRDKVDVISA